VVKCFGLRVARRASTPLGDNLSIAEVQFLVSSAEVLSKGLFVY
jgi:hypothetical protein